MKSKWNNGVILTLLKSLKGTDIIAGLSIAGLLLPEAVAYSGIANLPPQAGIIALFAGLVCYALLGTSRFAIVAATSSSAAILAAAVGTMANGDVGLRLNLSLGLVLLTGVFFLIAAMARLGSVTDFIAKPVLRGFAFGLAIVIIVKQFKTVVDISAPQENIFRIIYLLGSKANEWNLWGLSIAVLALLVLIVLRQFKRIPGGLIVIALGVAISMLVDLTAYDIHLVGSIDVSIDDLSLPYISQGQWMRLGELSLALSMVLYSESYGSIRNFAIKYGDKVAPNRDLFALGVANVVSALFHGMPVGAGYSATSANESAGATSRWSGAIAALVVLGIVVSLLPVIALTPEPILAAIVIYAVGHTLNPSIFKTYFVWKRDRLVVLVAVMGVLCLGVVDGLMAAVAMSILMLLRRFSESSISVLGRLGNGHDFVRMKLYPDAKPIEGITIFRPDQPLFFANSERMLNQARQHIMELDGSIHVVILSLEESPDLDSSTVENLSSFFEFIVDQNKYLILARLKEPVFQILSTVVASSQERIKLTDLSVDDAVQQATLSAE